MTVNQTRYKAVVIGCGFIGSLFNETPSFDPRHTHAASYTSHPLTDLVAVCDRDFTRAQTAAKHWQTQAYTNTAKMLEETQPAIVSVASSTETHQEMLSLALQTPSVRAILCEKPITENVPQSLDLIRTAQGKNIILSVNYSRRFNHGFQTVRNLLRQGDLGDIRIATVLYQKGILNNGSHFIDLLRFLMGEIVAVRAEPDNNANYNTNLSCLLEFEDKKSAYIHGTESIGDSFAEIDLICTKGRIRTEQCGHKILRYDLIPSPIFAGYTDFVEGINISEGLIDFTYNAVHDLIECLEDKQKRPSCTGQDAVKALVIVDAIIQSAKSGKRIEVK